LCACPHLSAAAYRLPRNRPAVRGGKSDSEQKQKSKIQLILLDLLLRGYCHRIDAWHHAHRSRSDPGGSPPPAVDTQKHDIIASIGFKGNTKYTDKQSLDTVQLEVGQKLDQQVIKHALDRLIALYRKDGGNLNAF
jgi:outer membrane protein assembly factor BamA